ncbi:MAG: hypothetical protein IPO58_05285 [Betaproteobacteria bacterium]|nr:hypothetical protein [Betaproteobacteria bacterium]
MTGSQAGIRIAACALAALAGGLSAAAAARIQTTPFGLNPADQGAFLQPANPERESPRMFSKSKHGGRIADWRLHHADGAGRVPDDAQTRNLRAFDEFVKKRGRVKAAGIAPDRWTALGGGPVGGRIRAILPHPADANTLWLGAATGGVWKTTDGGATWRAVGDNIASLTVSTMVIDAANTLYIGTGEWSQGHFGAGVFRSDDGGATWQFLPATDPGANNHWRYVSRMVAHPTQPGVIIAGTWRGIYRTADGGATWTRVHRLTPIGSESFFNHAHDIDFDPNNASRLTAGLVGGAVALSTDAGVTWQMQPIADIAIDLEGDTAQRVELAYSKSRPGRIYALVDRRSGDLYRSDDGGANWELMSNPKVLAEQGNYDNTLWADPFDDRLVIAGGVDLVRSTDGGATWKAFQSGTATSAESYRTINNTRTVIHPDFHWIVAAAGYDGAANRRVYLGNDGGVFRIEDVRTNLFDSVLQPNGWQRLNGDSLRVTQYYGVAASPDPNPYLAGGAQDNGVVFSSQGAGAATLRIASGDGMSPSIDAAADSLYYTIQWLAARRIDRASVPGNRQSFTICANLLDTARDASGADCAAGAAAKANFVAPLVLDPNNPLRLLAGGNSLWLSTDPRADEPQWRAIKPPSTGVHNGTTGTNYINAIGIADGSSNHIWVGHNNGELYATTSGTAATPAWSSMSGLPNRAVTSIHVDRDNHNLVFATYAGYAAGNLYTSADGGASWSNAIAAAQLPAVPFYSITRHPLRPGWLYLGTEIGLFASQDNGANWSAYNDGPANVIVRKLSWQGNDTLVLGTYGRGAFTLKPALDVQTVTVFEFYNAALKHYFRTADPGEAAAIDNGAAGPGWSRTGDDFKAWAAFAYPNEGRQVCRFYGSMVPGPNSHFYTASAAECNGLKSLAVRTPNGVPRWNYEGLSFAIALPGDAGCGATQVGIYRAYNNRADQNDSNHRYTTRQSEYQQLIAQGWAGEGIVMCAPA